MRYSALVLTAGAVALTLAACDNPTSPASKARSPSLAVIVNDHTESAVFGFNGCNGDFLSGTGDIHTVIAETIDPAGGFHINFKEQFSNVKLVGVPSGATYVASQEVSENINIQAAQEETFNETVKIIGQGQTPNEIVHFLLHITVNANGTVTSFVDHFTVDCH